MIPDARSHRKREAVEAGKIAGRAALAFSMSYVPMDQSENAVAGIGGNGEGDSFSFPSGV